MNAQRDGEPDHPLEFRMVIRRKPKEADASKEANAAFDVLVTVVRLEGRIPALWICRGLSGSTGKPLMNHEVGHGYHLRFRVGDPDLAWKVLGPERCSQATEELVKETAGRILDAREIQHDRLI